MSVDYAATKAMVTAAIEKRLRDPNVSKDDKKKYAWDLDCLSKHNADTPLKNHDTDPAIRQFINQRYQSLAKKFFFAYLHDCFDMEYPINRIPISDADILFMHRHYAGMRPGYEKQIKMRMYTREPALFRGYGWNDKEMRDHNIESAFPKPNACGG